MPWLAIAAIVVILVFSGFLWIRRMPGPVLAEVVDSHIRSLMVDHLVDVASSDQGTVRPWFVGRLDFSPPVGDFAADGFSLVGGRLDCINHHAVATLVYRRNQHVINVLVWPVSRRDTGVRKAFRQGYLIVQTNRSGLDYWIVSGLNADELAKLATLLALPQSK
jgi:anti-sigma factor RsiW